jgi:AcrR family transcriptional regulator
MRKSDLTKNKILTAALLEFSARGYDGVSVDQIARSAGVNKAMIYYHFENKAQLFNELFLAELEQLKTVLASIVNQRDVNHLEEMTSAVRELLAFMESKRQILGVLMSGVTMQPFMKNHLFQLLDISTEAGASIAQNTGSAGTKPTQEELIHELFTGLLPLICFVLLREGLEAYYGWDAEALKNQFIANWLRQHAGYSQ